MRKKQLNKDNLSPCPTESQTTAKPKKRKYTRKTGRKKIKRLFEETRVGYYLKYEAPLEYGLIMEVAGARANPSADLIESIGYASLNILFKKPKFRRALIEYRKTGLYSGKPVKCPESSLSHFRKTRETNIKRAIRELKNTTYETKT